VAGGESSGSISNYATVGGGLFNVSSDVFATVGGGYQNTSGSYGATPGAVSKYQQRPVRNGRRRFTRTRFNQVALSPPSAPGRTTPSSLTPTSTSLAAVSATRFRTRLVPRPIGGGFSNTIGTNTQGSVIKRGRIQFDREPHRRVGDWRRLLERHPDERVWFGHRRRLPEHDHDQRRTSPPSAAVSRTGSEPTLASRPSAAAEQPVHDCRRHRRRRREQPQRRPSRDRGRRLPKYREQLYATVAGGENNTVTADDAFIGGGFHNLGGAASRRWAGARITTPAANPPPLPAAKTTPAAAIGRRFRAET